MPVNRRSPVDAFRLRQKRAGLVRVEVKVAKEDAVLVRGVAKALGDPVQQSEFRRLLNSRLTKRPRDFKDFLLSAPLDGIDLTRSSDPARDVDL